MDLTQKVYVAYQTLDLDPSLQDLNKIRASYRKLARRFHPDFNPDDEIAEERFKEISTAFATIVGYLAKHPSIEPVPKVSAKDLARSLTDLLHKRHEETTRAYWEVQVKKQQENPPVQASEGQSPKTQVAQPLFWIPRDLVITRRIHQGTSAAVYDEWLQNYERSYEYLKPLSHDAMSERTRTMYNRVFPQRLPTSPSCHSSFEATYLLFGKVAGIELFERVLSFDGHIQDKNHIRTAHALTLATIPLLYTQGSNDVTVHGKHSLEQYLQLYAAILPTITPSYSPTKLGHLVSRLYAWTDKRELPLKREELAAKFTQETFKRSLPLDLSSRIISMIHSSLDSLYHPFLEKDVKRYCFVLDDMQELAQDIAVQTIDYLIDAFEEIMRPHLSFQIRSIKDIKPLLRRFHTEFGKKTISLPPYFSEIRRAATGYDDRRYPQVINEFLAAGHRGFPTWKKYTELYEESAEIIQLLHKSYLRSDRYGCSIHIPIGSAVYTLEKMVHAALEKPDANFAEMKEIATLAVLRTKPFRHPFTIPAAISSRVGELYEQLIVIKKVKNKRVDENTADKLVQILFS